MNTKDKNSNQGSIGVHVRGPNYNWEEEAKHYQAECKKLRDLIQKLESSGEKLAWDRYRYKKSLSKLAQTVSDSLLLDEKINDAWGELFSAANDAFLELEK